MLRRLASPASFVFAALVITPSADATSDCAPHTPRSYAVATGPGGSALADLDGDGDLDVVVGGHVGNPSTAMAFVLFNDGLGELALVQTVSAAGVSEIMGVDSGDIDGDLDADIVLAGEGSKIAIFRNDSGTLVDVGQLTTPTTLSQARLADLDGDTDLDLVNSQAVWQNDGAGGFTLATTLTQTSSLESIVVGDFDGDGDLDVSGLRSGAFSPLRTWINGGSFSFTALPDRNVGSSAKDLAAGDLDGDLIPDRAFVRFNELVVVRSLAMADEVYAGPSGARYHGTAFGDVDGDGDLDVFISDGRLRVYTNSGGLLTPGAYASMGSTFETRVSFGDLDGNGARDVVTTERLLSTCTVRLNDGTGQLEGAYALGVAAPADELVLADLDGDGLLDVAGSEPAAGAVWRNTGSGNFAATAVTPPWFRGPVRAVDMNGDARPELLNVDTQVAALNMRFNGGAMNFSSNFGQATGVAAYDLASGDLDGDGDQDLIVGAQSDAQIAILENDGTGIVTSTTLALAGTGFKSVEVADVDGDTDLDIVATSRGAQAVSIFTNDGTGAFAAAQAIPAFPSAPPVTVVAADLDRDGDVDLAVGTISPIGRLIVLANDGTGAFTLRDSHVTNSGTLRIVPAVLDGGASPDLCTVDVSADFPFPQPGRITVWSNRGDATFVQRSTHIGGGTLTSCAVADLDADGRNEIYASARLADGRGGPLLRFQNTGGCSAGTPICAGDGSLAPCPCGNSGSAGNGCANSVFAGGARLSASGVASVANDTLLLECGDMTGNTCIFVQGSALTAPMALDDGLTCVGSIVRVGNRNVAASIATFPQLGNLPVSVRGAVPPSGGTFHYQSYYRNASTTFCPPATSNRTNGLTITWAP